MLEHLLGDQNSWFRGRVRWQTNQSVQDFYISRYQSIRTPSRLEEWITFKKSQSLGNRRFGLDSSFLLASSTLDSRSIGSRCQRRKSQVILIRPTLYGSAHRSIHFKISINSSPDMAESMPAGSQIHFSTLEQVLSSLSLSLRWAVMAYLNSSNGALTS